MLLRQIPTLRLLDLSENALPGSIPGGFWSSTSLADVNLAANRLGGALRFVPRRPKSPLHALNLSGNRFTSVVGLSSFPNLQLLNLSLNSIIGSLSPILLHPPKGLRFFNVSYNNFTGRIDSRFLTKLGGGDELGQGMGGDSRRDGRRGSGGLVVCWVTRGRMQVAGLQAGCGRRAQGRGGGPGGGRRSSGRGTEL